MHVGGFSHVNPVPAGCLMGNLLVTGAITGIDPATGTLGTTVEQQCANIFHHMRTIVAKAGGGVENIVKVTVWHNGIFRDVHSRGVLNAEWLKMFPDENSRPARHAVQSELGDGHYLMCDMMALVEPQA